MIEATLVGAQRVQVAMQDLGAGAPKRIERVVRAFGIDVLAAAKVATPVKTGRLKRSINMQISNSPTGTTGRVGPNTEYAALIEFGYSGEERVKSFQRKVTMVFGRSVTPHLVTVREFTRRVNRPGRHYLGRAFDNTRPTLRARLLAELGSAVK